VHNASTQYYKQIFRLLYRQEKKGFKALLNFFTYDTIFFEISQYILEKFIFNFFTQKHDVLTLITKNFSTLDLYNLF